MRLFVLERLMLLDILPTQGSFTTLRIVRDLQSELSFSEEEHERLELHEEDGKVFWRMERDEGKEVSIGETAHEIIVQRLRELDEKGKLKAQQLPVYERFVLGEEPEVVREAERIARGE